MKRPAAVTDLLSQIFHDKPAGKRLKEGKIWLVWDHAVGEQIAARARPSGFRDGTLTITVDSAPWIQQLTYLKAQLIATLNTSIGEDLVKEIYLKAGIKAASEPGRRTTKRAARRLTAEEEQMISENSATIPDPELRDIISRLMGKHLQNT